ncbi:MAG TPA: complex I NDUFA9 subunit family protein [Nitrospiria bacterium]|nr:complex I NDUFA9 subunit family protein [Nitrospiria bacterium]
MKIFVTGGTGFVGREIVRQLHGVGHKVRCLVRDAERARRLLPPDVELYSGDLNDSQGLAAGVKECQAVIHLVGIIVEKGRSTFERIHVQGTEDLLKATAEARIRRFIHMSALGSRPNAPSRYHQTKYRGEQAVIQSGLDWTIFRPSVVFGPGDQFVNLLARIIQSAPVVPVIGRGESRIQPISVRNVASCFALAVGNQLSYRKIYELGGPRRLTYNQIYQIIARVLNKKKKAVHIPVPWVKPGALISEWLLPNPPITREQLIMLQEDNICDPTDAVQDFGLELQDFEEGVREFVKP